MSIKYDNLFSEEQIGLKIKFYLEDGTLLSGNIASIPNDSHVSVFVDHKNPNWEWYVRSEAVLFV